jgi:hypothetical protein
METIQIEVSPELAQRLRPYQDELPDILERALRQVEQERERQAEARLSAEELALQRRISVALRQAGARGADPDAVTEYLDSRENQDWVPIQTNGMPASKMIVEERASRSWSSR